MPSERIQRRIDALLDEADAAVSANDWETVRQRAMAVLSFDDSSEDARSYVEAAEKHSGGSLTSGPPVTSTSAPPLPASFAGGRYAVRKFLGEGGRKRVYLAHDERLARDVAVAIIKTDGLDAEGLSRVRREAQAMGRLGDHPHIVTVFDTGDDDGQPYIVSQYMSGGDVASLLRQASGDQTPTNGSTPLAREVGRGGWGVKLLCSSGA